MTQAFNLSQLANNLNTSGQLDATDGLTGAVPVANGGTGQTTYSNGQLLIGNGSGLTKANITAGSGISVTNGSGTITIATSGGGGVTSLNGQTGAITNTDLGAIGSYIASPWAVNSPSSNATINFDANSTISGASLRYNYTTSFSQYTGGYPGLGNVRGGISSSYPAGGTSLSGTWRCVTATSIFTYSVGKNSYGIWNIGLWVRIS
jgi:hypothetical protein